MFITPSVLPSIPLSLPVYRTIRPRWTRDDAARFAARLGVDAPVEEFESLFMCRKGKASVEIFQATHSARVTHATFDREGTSTVAGRLPSDDAAIERANRFVEGLRDLHRSEPLPPRLSRIEAITAQAPDGPRRPIQTVAVQVNYRFTLDGLVLKGPGAKAQVTIGRSGEIDEAYLFWRQAERTEERWTTRPAAAALGALAESPHFARVIATKGVAVVQVQLGWLCLPPTFVQDTLFPVYEIRGRLVAEVDVLREFKVYVAAARTPLEPSPLNLADRWPALVIA